METNNEEINKLFEKFIIDNEVADFPLATLTNTFHKLEKYTSYEMGYYEHRQAYHIINDISKFLSVHLNDSKKTVGLSFRRILFDEYEFAEWYKALPLPYKKYVCSFLDFGDLDFLKGFMTQDEINKHFNQISWSRASLIATYFLHTSNRE